MTRPIYIRQVLARLFGCLICHFFLRIWPEKHLLLIRTYCTLYLPYVTQFHKHRCTMRRTPLIGTARARGLGHWQTCRRQSSAFVGSLTELCHKMFAIGRLYSRLPTYFQHTKNSYGRVVFCSLISMYRPTSMVNFIRFRSVVVVENVKQFCRRNFLFWHNREGLQKEQTCNCGRPIYIL